MGRVKGGPLHPIDPVTGRFLAGARKGKTGPAEFIRPLTTLRRVLAEAMTPEDIKAIVHQYYLLVMADPSIPEVKELLGLLGSKNHKVKLDAAKTLLQLRQSASQALLNRTFGYPATKESHVHEELKTLSINVQTLSDMSADHLDNVILQIDNKEALGDS